MAIQLEELVWEGSAEVYEVIGRVETGICIGSAGVGGVLVDKPAVKDASNRFLIPGSHLKGRLRQEYEKLLRGFGKAVCESPRAETMCPQLGSRDDAVMAERLLNMINADYGGLPCGACRLFGNPRTPSAILVSDLVWDETGYFDTIRNRVAINRRRRTAEDERLFFIETAPNGVELQFRGRLFVQRVLAVEEKQLLAVAFKQIHALGSGKGAGIGWLYLTCIGLT